MFDMNQFQSLLNTMQEQIKELESSTQDSVITAKSGGGLVGVSMNGAGEVVDISIDDSLLEDKESLQILLISALNDAHKSVESNKRSQALNLLGGINPFNKS